MKKIMILLIIIITTLFACTAPAEQEIEQEPEAVPEVEQERNNEETEMVEEPQEVQETPVLSMDSSTRELREKGVGNTNYRFTYTLLEEGRTDTEYFVRDSFVKVEPRLSSTRSVNTVDTIYLNIEEEVAVGFCERGSSNICQDESKLEDLSFEEYYVELPHEVITRLDNGEHLRSVTYRSSASEVVRAQLDGREATLTIHQFRGIPIKVEFEDGSGFEFRDLAFGTVTQEDVTPPSGW